MKRDLQPPTACELLATLHDTIENSENARLKLGTEKTRIGGWLARRAYGRQIQQIDVMYAVVDQLHLAELIPLPREPIVAPADLHSQQ